MSETNKDITVAFYKKALFEGRVEEAFRLYAVPTYRQHNPLIEDGMEGVKKFVTWIMSNHPDARGEIKRVFADGDHVILHSHWHGLSDNPRGEAVVDIFRLEGGKVLEHWDVIQPIPETSANANTIELNDHIPLQLDRPRRIEQPLDVLGTANIEIFNVKLSIDGPLVF